MSASIPFYEDTHRPISIRGNTSADHPVEFDLCAVGGQSRARLRSIVYATAGLQGLAWSSDVQDSVIAAFQTGAPVFAEGVSAIRNLTAPAALCLKAGLIAELPPGVTRTSQMPIRTGAEFSAICGHFPILAFEIAMEISKLSGRAEVDPAFFDSLGRSLQEPTPAPTDGTATAAPSASADNGTAVASRKAARRRTT